MARQNYVVSEGIRVIATWPEYKNFINGTSSSLAFSWNLENNFYEIVTEPILGFNLIHYLENTGSADLTDWENNFKNLSLRKEGSNLLIPITGSIQIDNQPIRTRIQDATQSFFTKVDSAGRIAVAVTPPTAPPATTAINIAVQSSVASITDTLYVIPNGQTLRLQRFSGGGEGANKNSVIELFFDPNGDGSILTIIRTGYVYGNNFEYTLDPDSFAYTGDGTRAIRLRRRRLDGGNAEMAAFWDGYLDS